MHKNYSIHKRTTLGIFLILQLTGCTPLETYQKIVATDCEPPIITHAISVDATSIALYCSEPVTAVKDSFFIHPTRTIESIEVHNKIVTIHTDEPLIPGGIYYIDGMMEDSAHNHVLMNMEVFGWNPSPPRLLINEFTTKGSKRHPDTIELIVLSDGNIAGMCLYDGIHTSYRQRCIFPSFEVTTGDYVVIHCTDSPQVCENLRPEQQFTMDTPSGLSANNGVISLYTTPYGECIDAVIYSNRTHESDESYQGFGNTINLLRASYIWESGQWGSLTGDIELSPEDALRSESMTATRSICRMYPPVDTDSAADWHIVPTSKASFGRENCNTSYTAKRE